MRALLPLLILALAHTAPPRPQDVKFFSASLNREIAYRVLLPAGYDNTAARRHRVLYLLHGLDGHFDDWTTRTRLAEHMAKIPADAQPIVVMPEGGNSWYLNWHDGANERWEDYLTGDLTADVETRFRVDARRESRFIAGLSMGGFAALRLGLKHPGRYAIAASLSGALHVTRLETYGWTDPLRAEFVRAFGPMGSARRRDDDVFELARSADPASLPFFYLDVGAADPFLAGNRELAALLQSRHITYEYRETPGTHNWAYWDRQIVEVLELIGRQPPARPAEPAAVWSAPSHRAPRP